MDLTNRAELKALLARHGIVLAKTYGQHFLTDRKALDAIVRAAFPALERVPLAVEVGPGAGTLTVELAARADRVVAIERDPRFLALLKELRLPNLTLIEADAMAVSLSRLVSPSSLLSPRYSLVSNLPYEITTPFLWKILFEEAVRPTRVVLLLQAAVVDRILATPPRLGLLGLLVRLAGEPRRVAAVPASSFFPPPKVASAVLAIEGIAPAASAEDRRVLGFAKRAFAAPRKKLGTTLGTAAGPFADRRPETLEVNEWREIAR